MNNNDYDCAICLSSVNNLNMCITECNHKFHISCLLKVKNNECPLCRAKLYEEDQNIKSQNNEDIIIDEFYNDMQDIIDHIDRNNYNRAMINDNMYN
jgi:hypothetical protein